MRVLIKAVVDTFMTMFKQNNFVVKVLRTAFIRVKIQKKPINRYLNTFIATLVVLQKLGNGLTAVFKAIYSKIKK